jgi:hypothetical protein
MHLEDIRKVLQHCYSLQAKSGPESAFRFAVITGSKRQRLFANYPDTSNIQIRESEPSRPKKKKKNKGKQREDPLQGLLRIEESVEPPIADHIQTGAGPSHQNDMVRIDMGQRSQLKDMGFEVFGPVNGPNEGLPEYEVPKAVFETLGQSMTKEPTLVADPDVSDSAPINLDPALLEQSSEQTGQQITDNFLSTTTLLDATHKPPENNINTFQNLQPATNAAVNSTSSPLPSSHVRPTTPPINHAESGANTKGAKIKTPKKRLGKRAQANLSPLNQTRSKKKKLTDDDRAALEAQNMVQSGSKRKIKRTQRE